MDPITDAQPKDLIIRQFRFCRKELGELIKIPASPGLHGFLVLNSEQNIYQQIRLLASGDQKTIETFHALWRSIHEANNPSVFPEIVAQGMEDDVLYYVSALPNGEPVTQYLARSGPLPLSIACQMVVRFVRCLRIQKFIPVNRFTINSSSLWVDNRPGGSSLMLGDIAPKASTNAATENVAMCLDLLYRLAGLPLENSAETLYRALGQAPGASLPDTLAELEAILEYIVKNHPPVKDFWTTPNQVRPILSSLVSARESAKQTAISPGMHSPVAPPLKRKPLSLTNRLKYYLGASAITLVLSLGIHHLQKSKHKKPEILKLENTQSIVLPADSIITRHAKLVDVERTVTPRFLAMLPQIPFSPPLTSLALPKVPLVPEPVQSTHTAHLLENSDSIPSAMIPSEN